MILIENIVGHTQDPDWEMRLAEATVDLLLLDQWEAQKSRLRKTTAGGVEIALSLDRNAHLHNGDILSWDAARRHAIVASIDLNEVMVVELDEVIGANTDVVVRTMFELGHALGNQHWPAVVQSNRIFVPLTVDRKVMASVMKTHAFPHIRYEFRPGLEVIPYMAPHEARRLFGGASAPSHAHPGPNSLDHDHHGHPHGHDHARAPSHASDSNHEPGHHAARWRDR